ncbi:hypothetical protein CC1G_09733 [Coprinopsis cinerea okayama7|uniref:Uncharacterized protein n=1 Tax=Coprinopsis cinerea (strain Okayama-7 / 130 / ATCC MYA-4618 / FGSC 9003) TaxID=240176 RepID=A8PDX2_COPC7|nr:hypothetical protein CC1G_09733 [Coprinopsis cinerea okayama7\|eukprot:XP_001840682.2 hypothetical protein CC1G_09733 [Coprinopsis cinerea okayama7\
MNLAANWEADCLPWVRASRTEAFFFSWSKAGAIQAAEKLGIDPDDIQRTNNPLESFNGHLKGTYWDPYSHSGRLPRLDLWVRLVITDIIPDFFEKLRIEEQNQAYRQSILQGPPPASASAKTPVQSWIDELENGSDDEIEDEVDAEPIMVDDHDHAENDQPRIEDVREEIEDQDPVVSIENGEPKIDDVREEIEDPESFVMVSEPSLQARDDDMIIEPSVVEEEERSARRILIISGANYRAERKAWSLMTRAPWRKTPYGYLIIIPRFPFPSQSPEAPLPDPAVSIASSTSATSHDLSLLNEITTLTMDIQNDHDELCRKVQRLLSISPDPEAAQASIHSYLSPAILKRLKTEDISRSVSSIDETTEASAEQQDPEDTEGGGGVVLARTFDGKLVPFVKKRKEKRIVSHRIR